MPVPSTEEYPWLIMHDDGVTDHIAWYQRAMLCGDFEPGGVPLPNYAIAVDGTELDPEASPVCDGCALVPVIDELRPVDRATGMDTFLDPFRSGAISWSLAGKTNPVACWYNNSVEDVAFYTVRGKSVLLCVPCATFLGFLAEGEEE
jgi:hypothetical protein